MSKIQDIQTILGVKADGIWGKKSQAALDAEIRGVATPLITDDGSRVDERSEKAIATLHPKVQPLARELVRRCAAKGIEIKVTSGTRTYDEQNELYAQGRSKPGRVVTNARGGYSNHNFGIAFDVTIFRGGKPVWESPLYKTIGETGEILGLTWGGRWTSIQDEPHFELKPAWAADVSESAMLSTLRARRDSNQDAFA